MKRKMTTSDYNALEIRNKKRLLKTYKAHGAIMDDVACKKARDIYWNDWRGMWSGHSSEWRTGFYNASVLASGINLFLGGWYITPYGDPDYMDNIKSKALEARFFKVEGKNVKYPGAESVRTYYRNIIGNRESLIGFGGKEYYEEHLKGIEYAAKVFKVDLRENPA